MVINQMTATILNTFIQYGVLGVLGFIAIKMFMSVIKSNAEHTKKLFDFMMKSKTEEYKEIKDALSIIIKTMDKQNQNLIKYKYDIAVQFQLLTSIIKNMDIREDKMIKILDKIQEAENNIIKGEKSDK